MCEDTKTCCPQIRVLLLCAPIIAISIVCSYCVPRFLMNGDPKIITFARALQQWRKSIPNEDRCKGKRYRFDLRDDSDSCWRGDTAFVENVFSGLAIVSLDFTGSRWDAIFGFLFQRK